MQPLLLYDNITQELCQEKYEENVPETIKKIAEHKETQLKYINLLKDILPYTKIRAGETVENIIKC